MFDSAEQSHPFVSKNLNIMPYYGAAAKVDNWLTEKYHAIYKIQGIKIFKSHYQKFLAKKIKFICKK